MQLSIGSLQQKNGWWYIVNRVNGRQRWLALHTKDRETAQRLAVDAAPIQALRDDEDKYLLALIAQGRKAEQKMSEKLDGAASKSLTWSGLFDAWRATARDLTENGGTLKKYACQVRCLASWALAQGVGSPAALDEAQAQRYADARMLTTIISGRDRVLFRRVWRDLKMRPVWDGVRADPRDKAATLYRRLTVDEVRAIVRTARAGKKRVRHPGGWFEKGGYNALPDVADLVTMAYHTGLRLRDCAWLESVNVDGGFLRVVPEKTAGRKPKPLLIPLHPEALEVVRRLDRGAAGGRLFPRLADASLSKCLRLTFERAGVRSNAFGKASFHSLRATFISMMDEAGVSAHVTDAITGHAKQSMHARYTQPSGAALLEAVKKAIAPLGV